MLIVRFLYLSCILAVVAACAVPEVNRTAPDFSETKYATDLNICRGGNVLTATLYGFGGAFVGSAVGAAEGATTGAIRNDSAEGAIIGAIVGSILGLGVGAYEVLENQDDEIENCLIQKGYTLS